MTNTIWKTPETFFKILDKEFNFTLDVAALPDNAKCKRYFTPTDDAMQHDWSGEVFWMNPPYGRGVDVYSWVQKAYDSTRQKGTGVCLLPGSVDTKWFHRFCLRASEIRFIKDRLWFSQNGTASRANHASIIVVFKSIERNNEPEILTMSNGRT